MVSKDRDERPATPRRRLPQVVAALALFAAVLAASQPATNAVADWGMIGKDPGNNRNQPAERTIGASNVVRLAPKWVATVSGDISATPAVSGGAVYFADFGGTVWKLDAATGSMIWKHSVADYTGIANDYSRSSPSLAGNTLVIGDMLAPNLIGIDAKTGALRWKTQVHPNARGIMTGSPMVVGDTIITGVSSTGGRGPTATFRGAVVAVHAQTGKILWQSYSLPDNRDSAGGYSGATMFAPPSVDATLGLVYGLFGQTYTVPAAVTACHTARGGFTESCEQPGAYQKAIVAFDLHTGAPRWSYRVLGHDPWMRACGSQPATVTWCGAEADAEKWDLGGSAPNVFQLGTGATARRVVGIGEKSGVYIVLDAKTGEFIWNTLIGPGGDQGGTDWGTAYDGTRIYVPITNHHYIPYKLTPSGESVTGGSWAALDPPTGRILWQTAVPMGAWALAPVSVANGVMYGASMAKNGSQMFALDAATGKIMWHFALGATVNAAPAIVNGTVYWGSGYGRSGEGTRNDKFYAFTIDGK